MPVVGTQKRCVSKAAAMVDTLPKQISRLCGNI
jgi:hypothetical protein